MSPSELPENFLKLPDEAGVKPSSRLPAFLPRGKEAGREDSRSRRKTTTSHRFQPTTCHHCHAVTLHGIAAEGLTIHLDPTPLDATTEAQALIAGHATWHMTPDLEVCWRTNGKIRYWPATNTREYAVFADHVCGQPIPATISSWAWEPHAPTPISEEPPF